MAGRDARQLIFGAFVLTALAAVLSSAGWLLGFSVEPAAAGGPDAPRIMAIGDSVTMGATDRVGWRYPFQTQMRNNNCTYDMVGPDSYLTNEVRPDTVRAGFDHDHEAEGRRDSTNIGGQLRQSAPRFKPDVAMLYMSVQDITADIAPDRAADGLSGIVARLREGNPNVTVFVARIAPPRPSLVTRTNQHNTALANRASQLSNATSRVIAVDMATGWTFGVHATSDDYVHPAAAGDQLIGNRFFTAFDNAGLCRPFRNGDRIRPGAPRNLRATTNGTSVTLNWNAAFDNQGVSRYVVQRNHQAIPTVGVTGTSFTATGLQAGRGYLWTVYAVDNAGNQGPGVEVFSGNATRTLRKPRCWSWLANGVPRVGWSTHTAPRMDIYVNGGLRTNIANNAPWIDNNPPGGLATYTATIVGADGWTSRQISCGAQRTAGNPGNQNAVAVQSCASTATNNSSIRLTFAPAGNDNASRYAIYRSRNDGPYFWSGVVGAAERSFTNNSLSAARYRYQVRTIANNNTTASRNCTPTAGTQLPPNGGGGTGALAVASCSSTALTNRSIRVTWTRANNDNANRFAIYRSRNNGPYFWAGVTNTPGTTFTNTNINPGTYRYQVRTVANNNTTASRNCTPTTGTQLPPDGGGGTNAVAAVSCSSTALTNRSIRVTWTRANSDNANRFAIYRSRNNGPYFWAGAVNTPTTTFTNTNINPGTYRYQVRTVANNNTTATRNCTPSGGTTLG